MLRSRTKYNSRSDNLCVVLGRKWLTLFFLISSNLLSAFAEDIPVDSFFDDKTIGRFRISPDGKTVCAIGTWKDVANLFVIDLGTGEARRITSLKRDSVDSFFWANNERVVFTIKYDGFDNQGFFAVNIDGSKYRVLKQPITTTRQFVFRYLLPLDRYEQNREQILVASNEHTPQEFPDLYRLDVYSGKLSLVEKNPGRITSWHIDWNGDARIAVGSTEEGGRFILFRPSLSDEWREIARFAFGEPFWLPVASLGNNSPFSKDGKTLFIASHLQSDTAAIQPLNLEKMEIGPILYRDDTYDVSTIIQSNRTGGLLGVTYEATKPKTHWFHEEMIQLQRILEKQMPNLVHRLLSVSDDEERFIFASFSDRVRAAYSLFTIKSGKLDFEILAAGQSINPDRLSQTKPIKFTARDGTTLHGYLTLPVDKDPLGLPLILHPHGGPWVRDTWGFNTTLQFLANRGFAVLQVDFRSSNGYGLSFLHAGNKRWATLMQEDLADAIDWAIAEGIADPDRIGIYGASYGGYATLSQLIQYPERYKFGICSVGPANLEDLIKWRLKIDQESTYEYYTRTIGDPQTERELLAAHSPINYMDRLQAPLMIVHGTKDPRVPIGQAIELRKTLEKLDKPYEWIVKKDEGHGFEKPKNRIELFNKIDAFIAPYRDPQ